MGGAGGNLAKNYVHQRKGDPYVLYLESNRIFVNRIVGTTNLTYTDVTPIARVMTEYLVWAVRADSPFKSAKDILDRAKANPSSIVFGVGTVPGNDQMNILRAAMAYGIDVKKVQVLSFKSSADATIQLLGGHTPVVSSGLSELLEHARAGKVRLVAISAPSPLGGELRNVPTWRSMGVESHDPAWRGLLGPRHAVEAVKMDRRSRGLMKSRTPGKKKALTAIKWFDAYADSATFAGTSSRRPRSTRKCLRPWGWRRGWSRSSASRGGAGAPPHSRGDATPGGAPAADSAIIALVMSEQRPRVTDTT